MDYIQEAVEVHSHSSRGVINMPNTLRRKMFKLGGSANTHGVGITSGLKMKKGGSVTTPIGVGSGKQPMKMGPDGKMREGHVAPVAAAVPFLLSGGLSALRFARAIPQFIRGGRKVRDFFRVKPTGPVIEGTGRTMPFVPGQASTSRALVPFRGDTVKSATEMARRGITGMDRLRQAGVIAGVPVGLAAGAGGISSLFPRMEDPKTLGGQALEALRGTAEAGLNIATFAPSTIAQAPFRAPGDIQGTAGLIRTALYGSEKPDEDDDKAEETISEQETQMEKLRSDAEEKVAIYQSLMGTPDNTATYAKALLNFGATALAGTGDTKTDLARAVQAGTEPLVAEAEARKATDQSIRSLAIQEVIAKDADDRKLLQTAAASGPRALNRMTRALEARDAGVTVAAEIDAKGNLTNAAPGAVLADLDGAFGSKFVAINEDGEAKPFNNIEEALAFAGTKKA